MNQDLINTVAGVMLAALCGGVGYILGKVFSIDGRLIRIETLIEAWGDKAAKILHSPHHAETLDPLLEKYLDHGYDLSIEEWRRLLNYCTDIEDDRDLSKGERAMAGMLAAVCHQKLNDPKPVFHRHE